MAFVSGYRWLFNDDPALKSQNNDPLKLIFVSFFKILDSFLIFKFHLIIMSDGQIKVNYFSTYNP